MNRDARREAQNPAASYRKKRNHPLAFAASAVLAGACLAPQQVHAQVGLSHSKKGSSYLSIEGGYQNSGKAQSAAPQAGGANPFGNGINVQERASAGPGGSSASASSKQGNNSANSSASAGPQGSQVSIDTQLTNGARSITTTAAAGSQPTSTSVQSNSATTVTGQDVGAGTAAATDNQTAPNTNANAGAESRANFTGTGASVGAAAGTSTTNGPPPGGSTLSVATANNGTNNYGQTSAVSAAVSDNTTAVGAAAGASTPNTSAFAGNFIAATPGPASVSAAAAASELDGNGATSTALGYHSSNGSTVSAFATSPAGVSGAIANYDAATATPAVTLLSGQPDTAISRLDAENGAYGGLSYGFVLPQRLFGAIDRIEAFGSFSNNDASSNTQGFSFSAESADGKAALALFDTNGITGLNKLNEKHREIGVRFKSDNFTDTAFPVIVSFEPFYRNEQIDSSATVGADYRLARKADVDMYGIQLGLETEVPIIAQTVSFVGRVSGGVYALNMDRSSTERIASYTLASNSSDDQTGYRLGAEVGIKLQMNATSFATLTGAADHLSDAPQLGNRTAAGATLDDQTDYQAKLNLTFVAE